MNRSDFESKNMLDTTFEPVFLPGKRLTENEKKNDKIIASLKVGECMSTIYQNSYALEHAINTSPPPPPKSIVNNSRACGFHPAEIKTHRFRRAETA